MLLSRLNAQSVEVGLLDFVQWKSNNLHHEENEDLSLKGREP